MCDFLKTNNFLFYDGGMGTMLFQAGLHSGQLPIFWNLTAPDMIAKIHRAYIEAGSDLICANTFGSNRRNLASTGHSVEEIVGAAVGIAKKEAGKKVKVGLDMGPIGELMEPFGKLSFAEVYEMYRETAVAGEKAGADFAAIETMSDLGELRAAILAVRENTSLPILATMTFDRSGRTYLGCQPESFVRVAEGLGVNAVGVNCSFGPTALLPVVQKMSSATSLPLIVKPNAGLPDQKTGEYSLKADDFAEEMAEYAKLGVQIIGGCCGTNPDYIAALIRRYSGLSLQKRKEDTQAWACTASRCVPLDENVMLGTSLIREKESEFRAAIHKSDTEEVLELIESELENGADILCVPTIHGDDLPAFLTVLTSLQGQINCPLAFLADIAGDLDAALRIYHGKACVLAGDGADMDELIPVIMKYGAVLMGCNPA